MTSIKLLVVWFLGAFFLLLGTFIITNLKLGSPGVSDLNMVFSSVLALVLFLGSGICWISVAVAAKHG